MKWTNDEARASAIKSRHETWQVLGVAFFVFLIFGSMVTGCTYYNVEKVKQPVEYNRTENINYERGEE